jgi:ferrous iron transport protein A
MKNNNDLDNHLKPEIQAHRSSDVNLRTPEASENCGEIVPKLNPTKAFPLAMASVGECLKIVKLKGSEGIVKRLIGMGFVAGCEVQIISSNGGSVIVALADNRIGLGVGMAEKIMCTST